MKILWDNKIDEYTPTSTTEVANFEKENVQDIRLSRTFRTSVLTDAWVKIDTTSGIDVSAAAIAGHNLTNGATIKIQGNDTDSWTSPTVDETLAWNAGVITGFFTEDNLRYWRFLITDAANPDGYIEIGRLFLGTYLQMPPVEPGVDIPRATTSRSVHSITGQTYSDKGIQYRIPAFSFPLINETQRSGIDSMWAEVENTKPVFLLIWENSLTVVGAMYAKIDQDNISWRKLEGLTWSLRIAFREEF